MRYFILSLCLFLAACSNTPKCTNIALYDYGEAYNTVAIHWWEAEYRDYPFFHFDGLVIAKRYLGQGTYSQIDHCKDPVFLDGGWYSVNIDDGQGSWILVGQGWGKMVDVKPNSIRPKDLKELTERRN